MEHRVRTCSPLDAIGFNLSRSPQTSHPALFFPRTDIFSAANLLENAATIETKGFLVTHTHTRPEDYRQWRIAS